MDNNQRRLPEYLRKTEIFGCLNDAERLELARISVRKDLKKGEIVCDQGYESRFVLYIASGKLRSVINAPDGREFVVSTWSAGEEFWSHTLLDDEPMPSRLEAIKPTIIFLWSGETAMDVLLRNHIATRALLRRQTQLIRKRRESIYSLAFNPVASRLAKLILEEFNDDANPTIQRDLTLEEMAAMVATSSEVICRVMYQFQAEGLLSINRASITLQDREALEKLIIQD